MGFDTLSPIFVTEITMTYKFEIKMNEKKLNKKRNKKELVL